MLSKLNNLILLYLFTIVLGADLVLFNHEGFASRVLNYSLLILVVSIIFYLKELRNEK